MKNFWRRMAAREGFTLVELVVVIAILAILAAVAYPAYTGYISKAEESADLMKLDGIKTAAQAAAAADSDTYGTSGVTEIKVTVGADGAVDTITINNKDAASDTTFVSLLGVSAPTAIKFESVEYAKGGNKNNTQGSVITWTGTEWTATEWTATVSA